MKFLIFRDFSKNFLIFLKLLKHKTDFYVRTIYGRWRGECVYVLTDNMLFMHEITWLLIQLKALIILNICMLSYFKHISIILYYFMLWS